MNDYLKGKFSQYCVLDAVNAHMLWLAINAMIGRMSGHNIKDITSIFEKLSDSLDNKMAK